MYNEDTVISKWAADLYDQTETETEDVAFLLSELGERPKRVLEIACGSGRILVPLAKAGHDVTGLDFDECMLQKIGPKAEGLSNLRWRRADVVRDDWGSGYDAVVLAGNILFNIISDLPYEQAQQRLIQKAAGALVPGGSVYIDYGYITHPERWFGDPSDRVIWEGTDSSGSFGRMLLCGSRYDSLLQRCTFVRRFELTLADGTAVRQEIPSLKHFAALEQIRGWLRDAGFIVRAEYGGYDRENISDRTGRAIICAQKNM